MLLYLKEFVGAVCLNGEVPNAPSLETMGNNYESDSDWRNLKILCWVIGILAIAVLAVIIFVKVVWWLAGIGAVTVVALLIWMWYLIWKAGQRIKQRDDEE